MKVSKQFIVVTGSILTFSIMLTLIGFQFSMNKAEASINSSAPDLTEAPVKEASDIKEEMMAKPPKEIMKQGEKYQYFLIEDEGELPPGEKDITVDEALYLTMNTLNQLFDFTYEDQVITVDYMSVIFVSDDVSVDTYHVTVNGPKDGDSKLDGYFCTINSITGEVISVNKYIDDERLNEYNYTEIEEGYAVTNQTKKIVEVVALDLLEKYHIYDKDKVKITDVKFNEYDVRKYEVYFKTDKGNNIILEVSQKSQELLGYWVFPKAI
ncbi:MAG: hypothetical protein ACRCST_14885 [Turicibacter sp.]